MEKGIAKTWTPEQEELWARRLKGCRTFAERHLTMIIHDLLKYDGRSKAGKRALAQGMLRLATATDDDLREMAELQEQMQGGGGAAAVPDTLEKLKSVRADIRGVGIKKEELQCH